MFSRASANRPTLGKRVAQVIQDHGIIWLQLCCSSILVNRFQKTAGSFKCVRKIVVVHPHKPDGFAKRDRMCSMPSGSVPQLRHRKAQVVMSFRVVWPYFQRLLEILDGFLCTARLDEREPQIVVKFGAFWCQAMGSSIVFDRSVTIAVCLQH